VGRCSRSDQQARRTPPLRCFDWSSKAESLLGAPVRTYVPELQLRDEQVAREVTVLNLLNHTAGWDGDLFEDTGEGDDALDRYVKRMATIEQVTPLGSIVSYNNASLGLAGYVIERVTGQRFEEVDPRTAPRSARDAANPHPSTVVDMAGRRIISDGSTLPLSDLEYRVLSALLSPVGRAISFRELRSIGWGDSPELPADVYSVRALVQRLRAKLEVAGADIEIEAIRGYGFRSRAVVESPRRLCGA
jgi:hypothetical protein